MQAETTPLLDVGVIRHELPETYGAEVVHYNNITMPQGESEAFFDIGIKHFMVDRSFKHKALRCPIKPD